MFFVHYLIDLNLPEANHVILEKKKKEVSQLKRFVKWFLNGLLVIAPIGVTIYIVAYLFTLIDRLGKKLLIYFSLPTVTGMGLLITLLLITVVGFFSQMWLSRKLLEWTEKLIERFPGLKTIYGMVKDTVESFIGEKKSFSQVVLLTEEDGAKRVGFLTAENVTALGLAESYVAVYIPHGLQVSGELKLYPRERIEFISMPVEEAMRFCLTAGVAMKKQPASKQH